MTDHILRMDSSRIALKTYHGIVFLDSNDILCCIAKGKCTKIITCNGKEFLLSKVLKDIEDCLPCDQFFRTHKSYLINLNHLVNYRKNNEKAITLENNVKILLSRRRKKDFQNRINEMAQTL